MGITAQKMKFSIKDFFCQYDQIRSWSHLQKKSLMENFIFLSSADYSFDNPYSHWVVSKPIKAKGELKLEARCTALKNSIHYEISSLNSKVQSVATNQKLLTPKSMKQ